MIEAVTSLSCEVWIYILAVSFQLGGAEVLIYQSFFVGNARKDAERKASNISVAFVTMKTDDGLLRHISPEVYESFLSSTLVNRIAFILIGMGYLLGVWGNTDENYRFTITVIILAISIIIVFITALFLKHFVKTDQETLRKHGFYVS